MDGPTPQTASTVKSLTPQRKHRKLLKDGSGTAVWPESIEKVFVQGLREYWESPWATYSRGRSRWRNQFLVDYLQSVGITRTKKQVASHIQVLRNMWKGEPEYALVAGGDELFQEPVKIEEQHQPGLLTIDPDDDGASSLSNSPLEMPNEFPPSPGETSPMFPGLSYSPSSPLSSIPDIDSPPHPLATLATSYPQAPNQKPYPGEYASSYSPAAPFAPVRYPNRITDLTLLAEGMTPFTVRLDKLFPPTPLPARTPPLAIRLRLAIPPVADARAPPTLHGFFASVQLTSVWSSHAKVFTRVYDAAGRCLDSTDAAALHASNIDLGTVVANLPESTLTRARWCDPAAHTTITQQIVVDNATLLFVVYELDRRTGQPLPSVEFVSFQKYTGSSDARTSATSAYPPSTYPQAHAAQASAPPAPPTAAGMYVPPAPAPTVYSPEGFYHTAPYSSQSHPYAQHLQASPPSVSSLSAALTPVS